MELKKYGFRNTYGIDLGTSAFLYRENQDDYKESQCYTNAFHLCSRRLHSGDKNVKVVFGYVLSSNSEKKVAVRHAWNLVNDVSGSLIPVDVTMLANGENVISILNYTYLPICEYSAFEYLDAIDANNGYSSLPVSPKEQEYIERLKRKGFEVLL